MKIWYTKKNARYNFSSERDILFIFENLRFFMYTLGHNTGNNKVTKKKKISTNVYKHAHVFRIWWKSVIERMRIDTKKNIACTQAYTTAGVRVCHNGTCVRMRSVRPSGQICARVAAAVHLRVATQTSAATASKPTTWRQYWAFTHIAKHKLECPMVHSHNASRLVTFVSRCPWPYLGVCAGERLNFVLRNI